MNDENRPPTISLIPPTPPQRNRHTLEKIKETITPVHSSVAGDESSEAKIRTQVVRGSDQITGLARHEFKRDGQFGDPPPNPIGVSLTPLATASANIRATELDTNICKAEWLKSTIDWPFLHLFEYFHQGFEDAKYSPEPNSKVIAATKGINYVEDNNISEEQWSARAYSDGFKFGKRYLADRPDPKQKVVTEQFDYEEAARYTPIHIGLLIAHIIS
ncbi:hypothetical protein ABW20_dc0108841 [Dactylellina cionopaga]|nr:hypothetical protein ABW20_dc0108841 [Dactylellina cionopaga]